MPGRNIGFISTRFAGTDGVSLESAKWAEVLWDHGHVSYWYAGKLDRDPATSMCVTHAYFQNPDIQWINEQVFGHTKRSQHTTQRVYALAEYLKQTLYDFVAKFDIDILVVQNALTIPMNIPLGIACTNFIAETNIPTIAHHHDFYWERDRFSVNAAADFLSMAFPPPLTQVQHVTINSFAQEDLSHRCGLSSILVPNVLDFDNPPPEPDKYVSTFREDLGLADDDIIFLQPTRVVPRKGIEHSISLLAALKDPRCKLIISHESGDEGEEYLDALRELAETNNVDLRMAADRLDEKRTLDEHGNKRYTLEDFYSQADFITYPSLYEGFGNALLEAFYYRKPVLVNRYSIFIMDIEPRGCDVVTMNGYLTKDVVARVQRVINDPEYRKQMVDLNYEKGKLFFSYSVLRRKLRALVSNFMGLEDLTI